jgi:hypothetical protein
MAGDLYLMLAAWGIALLPLLLLAGAFHKHARFAALVLSPVLLALALVWGWVVGAPPGEPTGSDPAGGLMFSAFIGVRLLLLTGIFQLCFLSIPQDQLIANLRGWGLRGDGLIVAASAFVLWPELKARAEQVITARYARGLVPDRKLLTRFKQLPYMLRPLLIWSLRSAIQRTEAWQQRQVVKRATQLGKSAKSSTPKSAFILGIGVAWFALSLTYRLA